LNRQNRKTKKSLPTRKRVNATERKGVSFIRDVVEESNCVFREIDRAQDYGHDAFVLLVDGEQVKPIEIALQIKAGHSYCRSGACKFSTTLAQRNFWADHPLTTLGVVYDPTADCAWWVDLREESRARRTVETVSFGKAEWNRFDASGFAQVLLPTLLGQPPRIDLKKALEWVRAQDADTHELGARVLLARFRKEPTTWAAVLSEFRKRRNLVSFSIYRGLVRIMGHPDEGYFRDEVPSEIRKPLQLEIMTFGKSELIALLHFADDYGFERGCAGYGLFAIVPRISRSIDLMREIASDDELDDEIRMRAAQLLAIHDSDPEWWSQWIRNSS
jgi:hypothetical protein